MFRPFQPDQPFLLPVNVDEWLDPDSLAYFICDVVDKLDLSQIFSRYEVEMRGAPPFHPVMMVRILMYGYCHGITSSRKLEQHIKDSIGFRVLTVGDTPGYRAIAEFRRRHLDILQGLFEQVLDICDRAGLVTLEHVAVDSTKMKANASKHKAMSYERMKERRAEIKAHVEELLKEAERIDAEEDRSHATDRKSADLARERDFKQARLKTIEEAMAAIEAQAAEEAERARAEGRSHSGEPEGKAQRNFTDPDSKIMPMAGGKSFIQAYNCHAAVDSQSQVIVAAEATNQTSDVKQTSAMIEKTVENLGRAPKEMSADAGYYSAQAVGEVEAMGVEAFIAPDKTRHGNKPPPAPRGRIPSDISPRDRMRRKLRTKRGRKRYSLRMQTVEPVFGQIKYGQGIRGMSMRGKENAKGEWLLICAAHNLLKLYRNTVANGGRMSASRRPKPPGGPGGGIPRPSVAKSRPDAAQTRLFGALTRCFTALVSPQTPSVLARDPKPAVSAVMAS